MEGGSREALGGTPDALAKGQAPAALWERIERLQAAPVCLDGPAELGVVPTPLRIAQLMAERLLHGVRPRCLLHLLDPGCGSGRLAAAALRLAAGRGVRLACTGVETDAAVARRAQALRPLVHGAAGESLVAWNIRQADFLLATPPPQGFDLLIANPPYVSRRDLSAAYRAKLLQRYPEGRRGDLSALFLEHGLAWLRQGGRLCAIVPNKLLAADYAAALRQHLFAHTRVEEIWDLGRAGVFAGRGAYPVILVLQRRPPGLRQVVAVYGADGKVRARWPQAAFLDLPQCVVPLDLPGAALPLLRRLLAGPCLGDAVAVGCGIATPGFQRGLDQGRGRIICSGDIRPFQVRARRRFAPERVPLGARSLARQQVPKVVIPGMFLRLHAAFDAERSLLGRVYFVPVRPTAAMRSLLLALLNSRLYAVLYRGLFGGVAQAGGYLRLNAPYLRRLPWPERRPARALAAAVRRLERGGTAPGARSALDRRVEDLFALDAAERRLLGRLETALAPSVETRPRTARKASRQTPSGSVSGPG